MVLERYEQNCYLHNNFVELQSIEEGHPFFNLERKDNIVMFYTNHYKEQLLIVKGVEVKALGFFVDIIRASTI